MITSAVSVKPNEAWLTGAVNLAKVRGTDNDIGQIEVDLASRAYQPKIAWLDPASPLPAQIGLLSERVTLTHSGAGPGVRL